MKKVLLLAAVLSGALTQSTVASAADEVVSATGWWRYVSVQVTDNVGRDTFPHHERLCNDAETLLRSKYSDVTTVVTSISFNIYTADLYCRATGQSQQ
ncbi:MAG: hypothetical protein ACI8WB_005172 [Phenylobacterium sp.]|jgi:hypothetical protein